MSNVPVTFTAEEFVKVQQRAADRERKRVLTWMRAAAQAQEPAVSAPMLAVIAVIEVSLAGPMAAVTTPEPAEEPAKRALTLAELAKATAAMEEPSVYTGAPQEEAPPDDGLPPARERSDVDEGEAIAQRLLRSQA